MEAFLKNLTTAGANSGYLDPTAAKKSGRRAAPAPSRASRPVLRLLNERLVEKLENKILGLEKKLQQASEKTERILKHLVNGLAEMLELTDPFSADHQRRVARLAGRIGARMKLSKERIEGLGIAGNIHDIGKIAVPAEILSRPGKLNELEMSLIRNHPEVAFKILKDIDFPWPIARTVYQHHERMDGSGYPRGLKGKGIVVEARILGVSDVIEAMSSHRPYRPALGIDRALEEILTHAGNLYDTAVVRACLDVFKKEKFEFDRSSPAAPPSVHAESGDHDVMISYGG